MKKILVLRGTGAQRDSIETMVQHLCARLKDLGFAPLVQRKAGNNREIASGLGPAVTTEDFYAVVSVGYTLGLEVANLLAALPACRPLFCAALPDVPGTAHHIYDSALNSIATLAKDADSLLVFDEPSRSALEYAAGVSGKIHTLADLGAALKMGSTPKDFTNDPHLQTSDSPSGHGLKVLVSSHDFRFIADAIALLQRLPGVEVRLQYWELASSSPSSEQVEQARWADLIFCEWAGRNAVWYSHNLRDGQRLLVRLHGFEAAAPWIGELKLEAVEKVLTVSHFYAEQVANRLAVAADKITVVPNALPVSVFEREKLSGAQFHLGMLGFTPLLKRPQVAVDILRRLLQHDSRYTLHLRGACPTEYDWLWFSRPVEADASRQLYSMVAADSRLRESVAFEAPGANVESWLTRIGWILSLSERETFHVAAAEGMASGAVPVFLPREGVQEIFGSRWLFSSPAEIADFIHETVTGGCWKEQSRQAQQAALRFDFSEVADVWRQVIVGD